MWKQIIFLSFLWVTSCYAEYKYDLSICTIFRDEAPYLKEWIEYHRLLGVKHFYLCSHNSQDNYKEVLAPYIKKKIVELKELVNDPSESRDGLINPLEIFNKIQVTFFTECLNKAKKESKWVAFIDSDEFLVPMSHSSLVDLLKDYEAFGGVVANWQMFGTSYVDRLDPNKLMIEQLIQCAPVNDPVCLHVKSIVQPRCAIDFVNPHYARYKSGYTHVNTNKEHLAGPFSPYVLVDQLKINHYWTRDEYYFWNYKVPRQRQWYGSGEGAKGVLNQYNLESDLSMQRFVPVLRKKMGLRSL